MLLTDAEIEQIALEKYPKDTCLVGGCSGLKEKDKSAYERQIWVDGFRSALIMSKKMENE